MRPYRHSPLSSIERLRGETEPLHHMEVRTNHSNLTSLRAMDLPHKLSQRNLFFLTFALTLDYVNWGAFWSFAFFISREVNISFSEFTWVIAVGNIACIPAVFAQPYLGLIPTNWCIGILQIVCGLSTILMALWKSKVSFVIYRFLFIFCVDCYWVQGQNVISRFSSVSDKTQNITIYEVAWPMSTFCWIAFAIVMNRISVFATFGILGGISVAVGVFLLVSIPSEPLLSDKRLLAIQTTRNLDDSISSPQSSKSTRDIVVDVATETENATSTTVGLKEEGLTAANRGSKSSLSLFGLASWASESRLIQELDSLRRDKRVCCIFLCSFFGSVSFSLVYVTWGAWFSTQFNLQVENFGFSSLTLAVAESMVFIAGMFVLPKYSTLNFAMYATTFTIGFCCILSWLGSFWWGVSIEMALGTLFVLFSGCVVIEFAQEILLVELLGFNEQPTANAVWLGMYQIGAFLGTAATTLIWNPQIRGDSDWVFGVHGFGKIGFVMAIGYMIVLSLLGIIKWLECRRQNILFESRLSRPMLSAMVSDRHQPFKNVRRYQSTD